MAYTQSQTDLSVNLSSGMMSNGSTGIGIVAVMMTPLPILFCSQKLPMYYCKYMAIHEKIALFLLARDNQLLVNGCIYTSWSFFFIAHIYTHLVTELPKQTPYHFYNHLFPSYLSTRPCAFWELNCFSPLHFQYQKAYLASCGRHEIFND